jgi:hypothetical protein
MAIIQVQIGKNMIENVLLDGNSGINRTIEIEVTASKV